MRALAEPDRQIRERIQLSAGCYTHGVAGQHSSMQRLLGRPETRRTPRCEYTTRDVSTSESQRDSIGKTLFCDRVGTVADHEQQFQKSGVAVVTESTAQQVEDREAALL